MSNTEDKSVVSKYINITKKEIELLKEKHMNVSNEIPLIAYRGEAKDYGSTKLKPSIFRDVKYIDKELHLFELMRDYNIAKKNMSVIERLIEAQHYVAISRMLDITFSLLNALYFACRSSEEEDGILYIFAFPKSYSPHSDYIEKFYSNSLEKQYKPYARNFKVFTHSYSNDRIKAQKGGFIFFPGEEWHPIDNCYYKEILINKYDKKLIREELELLFQITDEYIFPEKDKIAEAVKNRFITNSYDLRSMSMEDEIHIFFQRIKFELLLSQEDDKNILRLLRKEERDLIAYINLSVGELDKEILVKYAKDQFENIRIKY